MPTVVFPSISKWITIMVVLFFLCGSLFAQDDFASAIEAKKKLLEENPEDKRTLKEIGFLYLHQANFDEAIRYGTQLKNKGYQTEDYDFSILFGHIILGQAYMMKGERSKAYNNLNQAKFIAESNENDSALCSIYNGLGLFSSNIDNDYYRSIDFFLKGIDAAKKAQHEQMHSILLINISGIYYLRNDATGLSYALEAYKRGHKSANPYIIFAASCNAAYSYFLQGKYKEALQYIKEAEFLMTRNGFHDQTNIYALYGHILLRTNNIEEAMTYFEQGLKLRDKAQTSSIVYTLYGYAKALRQSASIDKAISALNEALEITYEKNNSIYRNKVLKELSLCYEEKGELNQALQWQRAYQSENDSLFNIDKERLIGDLMMRYETERRENEIKEIKLNLLQKSKNEQILTISLAGIFLISLLLIYFIWRRNKFFNTIIHQYQARIRREKQMQEKLLAAGLNKSDSTSISDTEKENIPPKKYSMSSLTEEKSIDLFSRLEELMRDKALYKDKFLTKEKVAEALGTNRTYLSQVINKQTSLTFTQYINEFRINEAIKLMNNAEGETPLKAIASDIGFNSMTTFYKAFENIVGMTPSQFKNKTKTLNKLP